MGASERREKGKEIRRNDIIEAAERIFFTKGYASATMDDVAKEAEFSKRTVYVYFNSKEQIYFEIMTRGYRLLLNMLKEDLEEIKGGAVDEIRQMALTLYRFGRKYPEYLKAIMEYENGELDFRKGIPDKAREECYALGERVLGYLTAALERGIAERSVRGGLDVVKTALVLWACMIGVLNTAKKKEKYIRNYHGTEPEELVTAAFQLILGSIETEGGGEH